MATAFTMYLKDIVSKDRPFFSQNGIGNAAGKVVNMLKTYLEPVLLKNKAFSDEFFINYIPISKIMFAKIAHL